MTRIVGVHGIGNYHYYQRATALRDAAAAISQAWTTWLRTGIPTTIPLDLTVAYYAHHLHRGTPQGLDDDPAFLEPGAQDLLIAWVRQLQPHPQIALGPRTAQARQSAEWLTRHFGRTARVAAISFCREAHTYLARPISSRRHAARETVADTIARHRPSVVIAHSLGSVVTYEALWAHPELRIDMLITLGSPLGMHNVVFDRLQPVPGNRGSRPPGVAYWANLADIGDIVAIPRDLRRRFAGIDHHVPNLHIGDWQFHAVKNYLTCPDISSLLLSQLGLGPVT